ncbi:MAG: helix-turn-helix domain-containing protein [Opitutales bacterium]
MAKNKLQELAKYQHKIAVLEKELGRQRRKLLALPAKAGFRSVAELIAALRTVDQGGGPSAKAKGPKSGRRRRAKITPEIKAKVKALVGDKKTGAVIAKSLGISLPSVQNIKKELGLVKKRG